MVSKCRNILKENEPNNFSMYDFLYQFTISFLLSSSFKKWRNHLVFMIRWRKINISIVPWLLPSNKLFYYLIGKFSEGKYNFTANDFKCIWISCAFFQNILACRHRDHHILSRVCSFQSEMKFIVFSTEYHFSFFFFFIWNHSI